MNAAPLSCLFIKQLGNYTRALGQVGQEVQMFQVFNSSVLT